MQQVAIAYIKVGIVHAGYEIGGFLVTEIRGTMISLSALHYMPNIEHPARTLTI